MVISHLLAPMKNDSLMQLTKVSVETRSIGFLYCADCFATCCWLSGDAECVILRFCDEWMSN